MFDGMYDIASQLALKWARHGKNTPITVTEDFTRLTLDTIALCAMDFRFNSYYKDNLHPFVTAMSNFLMETGSRARRLPLPSPCYRGKDQKFFSDIGVLRKTANEVLQARKAEGHTGERKDLLSAMLDGTDHKTGQKMSDQSILDNLITFLIAGHETTSGLLSFAFYFLMAHPEAYRKTRQEVDNVCGKERIKFEHLSKLPYVAAVLRETLRLKPTIPVFNIAARKDEVIGKKYSVPAGELVIALLAQSHLDPKVYGEDFRDFKPERMLEENFNRLNGEFPNCWKPFGNGARACIGRPFAWQEALLVTAMLLQNFDFVLDDLAYSLEIKQTLTVKPKDLHMRAILRDELTAVQLEHRLAGTMTAQSARSAVTTDGNLPATGAKTDAKPLSIYYGSNSGTCQSMAARLAADAYSRGFRANKVDCIDNATAKLPTDNPVVFITASYEGQPPDNATRFVDWLLSTEEEKDLKDVSYAVFGCGHHDWASTLHRIPKLVDASIEKHGGCRIASLGLSDVALGNMFSDFETWEDDVFWPAMAKRYDVTPSEGPPLSVTVSSPRTSILHQDLVEACVADSSILTAKEAAIEKRSIEIQLPSDITYKTGDYLNILPINPKDNVQRVMRHFHLSWDSYLTISANALTTLPENTSLPAVEILGTYVELVQPATKRNILTLADVAQDNTTKSRLQHYTTDDGYTEVVAKRLSVLDLLESHPSITLPLSSFLRMLPPMRVRQYSISCSPLWDPHRVVLTYSVQDKPGKTDNEVRHVGVATSYLSSLRKGDMLHVSVRLSHAAFHPPADGENTPVMMIAAGTGIAPFRGFVQERAEMRSSGRKIAPAMLFFGCREPSKDDLYREELDGWESDGVVSVWRAYSRKVEESEGCKYVQDRLWRERDHVMNLWDQGAMLYICGSRAVGEAAKDMFIDICLDATKKKGKKTSAQEVREWFEGLKNIRYAVDVFD
ncbi:MAG: hypothetical protein Q9160_005617 [Pyrenula sp. 1 TL-2023]